MTTKQFSREFEQALRRADESWPTAVRQIAELIDQGDLLEALFKLEILHRGMTMCGRTSVGLDLK